MDTILLLLVSWVVARNARESVGLTTVSRTSRPIPASNRVNKDMCTAAWPEACVLKLGVFYGRQVVINPFPE